MDYSPVRTDYFVLFCFAFSFLGSALNLVACLFIQ